MISVRSRNEQRQILTNSKWCKCFCVLIVVARVSNNYRSSNLSPWTVSAFSTPTKSTRDRFEILRDGTIAPYSSRKHCPSIILRQSQNEQLEEKEDSSSSTLEQSRDRLQPYFSFPLDDWQIEAGGAIWDGYNVIVCAPTGAGKTVVGEMALHIAFESGSNAIYTTPLKALSNQKFTELRNIFGKDNVGLSTGDMSINRGARVTVMTTEVYRNMAWRSTGSDDNNKSIADDSLLEEKQLLNTDELADNQVVVLDEFHYMGQQGRGGVWEESVITSPDHTQIVGLSATLPNAARLASWMESVTGRKTILVEAAGGRPVPLRYMFASRDGLYKLFEDGEAGPGAPRGLLGLRGDGEDRPITTRDNKKALKKGYETDPNESVGTSKNSSETLSERKKQKFPKGLQVNRQLTVAAEKRMQRINRSIERQKMNASLRESDYNNDSEGKRRPRGGRRSSSFGMSPREERREREKLLKKEMRKAVPSLAMVLKRLERRKLLPAIFFIFSRAGCDEAKATVCQFFKGKPSPESKSEDDSFNGKRKRKTRQRGGRYRNNGVDESIIEDSDGRSFRSNSDHIDDDLLASVLEGSISEAPMGDVETGSPLSPENWKFYAFTGLLDNDEIKEVASRLQSFNEENEEIAFEDAEIEHFLLGVGSHHAGMLPAHKAFVEALYRAQLMKVVFATETLAAGINMPARTTVICSLAKRGNKSTMNLLATSNLLQMAGRAGRRGMDTDGTCVVCATPFEGPDEAVSILTSEIEPIVSQFSPSYSLAVNLVARGKGKLDIARQLVQKSFAMWEKRQVENKMEAAVVTPGNGVSDVLERVAHENFLRMLVEALESNVDPSPAEELRALLEDRQLLKKTSKTYIGASRLLDLERNTLKYLERELETTQVLADDDEKELLGELLGEDQDELRSQIKTQQKRVLKTEKEVSRHPFTTMATIANRMMEQSTPGGQILGPALLSARKYDDFPTEGPLSAEEISNFAKSAVVMNRKIKKLANKNPTLDSPSLLQQLSTAEVQDDTWQDMIAITKVLVAYGCLSTEADTNYEDDNMEAQTYAVTPAGINVGMLGFENSLWCLVAMGGAWDMQGASAELDAFQAALASFDEEDEGGLTVAKDSSAKPQEEAETLIELLQQLTPAELAGYVSSLVSEGSRGAGSSSIVESFQRLSPMQQRVIQSSLLCLERLMEAQKKMSVDESSRKCNLELSTCDVVTAWASGCSWSEALEMSGAAPGDLARTLARALDALRQLGNLPYNPVRAFDVDVSIAKTVSPGIRPEIRRLCREAARAMDRFPVKDPLPFETDESELADIMAEEEDFDEDSLETSEIDVNAINDDNADSSA